LLLFAVGLLISRQTVLLAAALALPLAGIGLFVRPIPIAGSNLYPQDLIVMLGFGAWVAAALILRRQGQSHGLPRTPVLGWPFVMFAAAILTAALRGHYSYGATLFGQPMRLVVYAAIVATLVGLSVSSLYRLLLWLFYVGTCVTTLWAVYYIASGTSQTDQLALSTGGHRILGISVSLYCSGALFLALLSLRLAESSRARTLHLVMAALALFCVVIGFGRAVYLAVAVVCLLMVALSRQIRAAVLSFVPLTLPFLALIAIALVTVAPDLVDAVGHRLSSPPTSDSNVQWRVRANRAVWEQIREQPVVGVGFGRRSEFFVDVENSIGVRVPVRQEILQDPHNGYLLLWAGGGLVALASFLLIVAVYAWDCVRRFRENHDPVARLIILWSAALLFAFLANAASGTMFGSPPVLVLPAVVPYRDVSASLVEGRVSTRMRPAGRPG
jgi:O-antigen ligase